MSQLSNPDALNAILARFEDAIAKATATRTQSAMEQVGSARDDLRNAIEAVRIGGRIAE